jgi:hypothetical protein
MGAAQPSCGGLVADSAADGAEVELGLVGYGQALDADAPGRLGPVVDEAGAVE